VGLGRVDRRREVLGRVDAVAGHGRSVGFCHRLGLGRDGLVEGRRLAGASDGLGRPLALVADLGRTDVGRAGDHGRVLLGLLLLVLDISLCDDFAEGRLGWNEPGGRCDGRSRCRQTESRGRVCIICDGDVCVYRVVMLHLVSVEK